VHAAHQSRWLFKKPNFGVALSACGGLSLLHSVAFRYDPLNKGGENYNNAPNWVFRRF
jgi:hypothetical protein